MHTTGTHRSIISGTFSAAAGVASLLALAGANAATPHWACGMLPAMALAQAAPAEAAPSFVVVTQGGANMRCADSDRFYVVAKVPEGTVLKSEGASGNWTIVRYPAGTPAFVRVEHVKVEGNTATTTEPTQLKAINSVSGFNGSYKSLLAQPLAKGTQLKVIEPVREGDGPVVAYKVVAPDSARGYIDAASLRQASEAEAKAAMAAMGIVPKVETPAPTAPTPPAPTTPATPDAGTPAATPGTAPAVVDLTQPGGVPPTAPQTTPPTTPPTTPTGTDPQPVTITQGGSNPGMPAATTPTDATAPGSAPVATPPATTPSNADVAPVDPAARRVGTVEQLEQTFHRVWREPVMTSEVDELVAEYERAIARETSEGRRKALGQRLEALKIRKDFRDRAIRQQEDLASYDQSRPRLTEQMLIIERGRVYTIIGELQPSTVYDGDRLPLMFRVVSVGGVAPRTLGYLRPTQEFTLKQMVGQVVGVIGDSTLDPSLKINVITPVRVDVMRPGELGRVETRELPWPGEAARPDGAKPAVTSPDAAPKVAPTPPAESEDASETPDTPAAPTSPAPASGGEMVPVPPPR